MRFIATSLATMLFLAPLAQAQPASRSAPAKAQQSAPAGHPSPEILRPQLEQTYREVRGALETRDYPAFTALVIPAKSGKPPPKDAFDKIAVRLLDDYPPLDTLSFVKIDRSGDWAGYYAENRVADPNRIDIVLFRFQRSGKAWKMSGRVVVQSISWRDNQAATLKEISANAKFRLPGQRGYRE